MNIICTLDLDFNSLSVDGLQHDTIALFDSCNPSHLVGKGLVVVVVVGIVLYTLDVKLKNMCPLWLM